MTKHRLTLRPIYADTDAEGVVYYGSYLAFLEKARTEFLRDNGFLVNDLKQNGLVFAVKNITADYLLPAFYDEELVIESSIKKLGACKIIFQQDIFSQARDKIIFNSEVLLVCLDSKSFKPIKMPEEFKSLVK